MELPHIEKLYRELKAAGFGLITITKDPAPDVLKMVRHHGITHPIVSDTKDPATGQAFEKYRAYDGKHYLVGSDGRILAAFSKLGISMPILRRELARHGVGSPDPGRAPEPRSAGRSQEGREPVAWKASIDSTTARPGSTFSVTLSAAIDAGWHIYALTQGSGGPTPLTLALAKGQPFALAGRIRSPEPDVKFDQNFGMTVEQYEGDAVFVLPVSVTGSASAGRQTLTIEAGYQACTATICLPPQTAVVKIPVTVAGKQ